MSDEHDDDARSRRSLTQYTAPHLLAPPEERPNSRGSEIPCTCMPHIASSSRSSSRASFAMGNNLVDDLAALIGDANIASSIAEVEELISAQPDMDSVR